MLYRGVLRRFAALGVGIAVLSAGGCISDDEAKYQELLAQSLRPADFEFAQQYLELLRNENFEEVKKRTSPKLYAEMEPNLRLVPELLRYFGARHVQVVGLNSEENARTHERRVAVTIEYQVINGWTVAQVVFSGKNAEEQVEAVAIDRYAESLLQRNAVTLSGKSIRHYAFILLMIGVTGVCIYSAVQCLRSPSTAGIKALWSIAMLVGISRVSLNWTSGEFDFVLLSFNIPHISVSKGGPYAPMILDCSLPVFALLFLFRRAKPNLVIP